MSDVLKRKLGASRAPKKSSGITLEAILRKTMPRDADAVLGLDTSVTAFTAVTVEKRSLRESIGPHDLVYLLETAGGERGLAILDLSLTAAVVEIQVSGRVSEASPPERPPTRTDGIVAGEIVDRWLDSGQSAAEGAGLDGAWPLSGYERATAPINRREAELLLEPVEFRVLDISLSLGAGARIGQLRLAAPRAMPLLEQRENTTAARVRGQLPQLPVTMRAVIANLPLGIADVRNLSNDTLLPLPDGSLNHVRLETREGRLVREVRLGQLDGKKAVRFHQHEDEKVSATPLAMAAGLPQSLEDAEGLPKLPAPDHSAEGESALPELPDLPPPPEAGADAMDLPDLPELPDLPDLPELPDLP